MPATPPPSGPALKQEQTRARAMAAANALVSSATPQDRPVPRTSPNARQLAVLAAPLTRAALQVDSTLVSVMAGAVVPRARSLARLEATVLLRLHRTLVSYVRGTDPEGRGERIDPVLADSLLEFVDGALQTAADLQAGGLRRLGRLWGGCRELAAELVALGGDGSSAKNKIAAARQRMATQPTTIISLEDEAVSVFEHLCLQIEAHVSSKPRSLLEDVLLPLKQ